jgi:maleate cis-trans isomerase
VPRIGVISPSPRGIKAEDLMRLLPQEIELVPAACDISSGSLKELEDSFACFDAKVDELAAQKVDLIHPAGVPFLLLGPDGERAMVERWEKRHGIQVFTNAMSQVNAARVLGAKRIIASSYFPAPIHEGFTAYLAKAGFEVLASKQYDADFKEVPALDGKVLRQFFDGIFERGKGAEAFYLIGPGWRATLGMIEEMEEAYGIPVIHHVPAQSWEIQRRLGFRRPVEGYGRLLRELP